MNYEDALNWLAQFRDVVVFACIPKTVFFIVLPFVAFGIFFKVLRRFN